MMDILVSLILVAIVTTITPGPSTLLAASTGLRFGFQRSLPLMAGAATGLVALMVASAAGLAALLEAVPALQVTMKVTGSAYFLWLAWKIGRSGALDIEADTAAVPAGFAAGFAVLCLNPKAWAMALGAAAAYAEFADGPAELAFLLGGVFGLVAVLSLSIWCAGGHALRRMVRAAGWWPALNAALGLLTAASVIPLWVQPK